MDFRIRVKRPSGPCNENPAVKIWCPCLWKKNYDKLKNEISSATQKVRLSPQYCSEGGFPPPRDCHEAAIQGRNPKEIR